MVLEIACFSVESALVAAKAGADRIELCDNYLVGGTTPPLTWLTEVKAQVRIPVFVMIRPRGGDFMYSESDFEAMQTSIDEMSSIADGFVFGILDRNGSVDVARTSQLVRRAQTRPCTFHRAFDETRDLMVALEDVVETGCRAILSSGGADSAIGGVRTLQTLVRKAAGRIVVMPGGGVRGQHLEELRDVTGAKFFHSSALIQGGELPHAAEIQLMRDVLLETPGR